MSLTSFFRSVTSAWRRSTAARNNRGRRRGPALILETLERREVPANTPLSLSLTDWVPVGPIAIDTTGAGVDYQRASGRITAVVVDPRDVTGNTMFIGTANGGVWRTTNGGTTWAPLMDFQRDTAGNAIPVPIGGLAQSRSNPNVLYAGTGVGDNAFDSRAGVGILKSTDGGATWTVAGNSRTVLDGARITKMAVDPQNPDRAYAAVSFGGSEGPGVYRTQDGGQTWVNILKPAFMFLDPNLPGTPSGPLGAGFALPSVTDLVIDPFNANNVYVGLGNIGQVTASTATGLWKTTQATANGSIVWNQIAGGDDPLVARNTLPTGTGVGRVTVALGNGQPGHESYIYVLIGNPPPTRVPGFFNEGTGEADTTTGDTGASALLPSGLYRSKDNGLNFTKVMLRQLLFHPTDPLTEHAHDINLLGVEASNVGALLVDPLNPNVVFVGGSRRFQANDPYTAHNVRLTHSLIRVDTSNMRDSTYIDPNGAIPNDGDDITKAFIGYFTETPNAGRGKYVSGADYLGEGVFWYDLEQDASGNNGSRRLVPRAINDFALSAGKLVAATEEGLYRLTLSAPGYDVTSGGSGIAVTKVGRPAYTKPTVSWAELNGNLAIADLTSIAIDPVTFGRFYVSESSTGTTLQQGVGIGTVAGSRLVGPNVNLFGNLDIPHGATIRVGAPDPLNPNAPRNVYRNWFYANGRAAVVERSMDGGVTFITPENRGLSVTQPAEGLAPLAVNPFRVPGIDPVTGQTVYFDELLFGTDRVYLSRTSANEWSVVGPDRPLSSRGGLISALAFAPPIVERLPGIYAGTTEGEVFVNLGNDPNNPFFVDRSAGLPRAAINSITVHPTNPNIAYVVMSDRTRDGVAAEVWYTANAGQSWTNISSNLPADIGAYSLVLDPRTYATTPVGRLFVGTDVGVFVSINNGATWQRLGAGLPNVPAFDLQLDTRVETLAVATQGRGIFALSTDIVGAQGASFTPTTPVGPGASIPEAQTPISSVTITFDEAIDVSTFTAEDVRITGPGGKVVRVTGVTAVNGSTTTFRITFDPQGTSGLDDGTYTVVIGPEIKDLVGNLMDQDGDGINGEATDVFRFNFVINSTDNGRFLSDLYHDVLGRAADTTGFLAFLSTIDDRRFALLPSISATWFVGQDRIRSLVISELYQASGAFTNYLGLGDLLGEAAAPAEVNHWLNVLRNGGTYEQILIDLVSHDRYFNQDRPGHAIGGVLANFVAQAYQDLLRRAASSAEIDAVVAHLTQTLAAARLNITLGLVGSDAYRAAFTQQAYQAYLGRAAVQAEVDFWLGQFRAGIRQEDLIANLLGSPAFFDRAPSLLNSSGPATNTTFIQAVYQTLFRTAATGPEVDYWLGRLGSGTTRQQVALELLLTDRYRFDATNGLVNRLYQTYLGRDVTTGELAFWQARYAGGLRTEQLVADLTASAGYYVRVQGGATTQAAQDAAWINAIARDLLGRTTGATPEELAAFGAQLAQAARVARLQLVTALVNSPEFKDRMIDQFYTRFLGRTPSDAERDVWRPLIGRPGGPGGLNGTETVANAILGSREYFLRQQEANGLHTNRSWVESLYRNLGLPVEQTGVSVVLTALLAGYQAERAAVANAFVASAEYRARVATVNYQTYLGRTPTQSEISSWIALLGSGATQEQLIAGLLGSQAFYDRSPIISGLGGQPTNTTFIQATYRLLFGVNATAPEVSYWLARFDAGTTRAQMAAELLVTDRYRFDGPSALVNRLYQAFLGRNATPEELSFWQSLYNSGLRTEQLVASLLARSDYFLSEHTFP